MVGVLDDLFVGSFSDGPDSSVSGFGSFRDSNIVVLGPFGRPRRYGSAGLQLPS